MDVPRFEAHDAVEAFEADLITALGAARHTRLIQLLEETRKIIRGIEPADRKAL